MVPQYIPWNILLYLIIPLNESAYSDDIQQIQHWENCLHFVYAPRCVSFFYAPNCINAAQKVNLKEMHPVAFYFSCLYTNGISLRIIIKDYIITQTLINETALNLSL